MGLAAVSPALEGAAARWFEQGGRRSIMQNEPVHVGCDGEQIDLSLLLSRALATPRRVVGIAMTARDGSAQKTVELDLRNSRDRLRQLVARAEAVREEERTRLARELHDGLGQMLTVLKMETGSIISRLSSGAADLADIRTRVATMAEHIDSSIRSVKRISTELRPGVLDHLGLIAAIEWQAAEFEKRTGIRCRVRSFADEQSLEPDRRTTVFRIFQGILTNIARHSRADRVEIRLSAPAAKLILVVKDNGIGIDPSELERPKSLGLLGMRERAQSIGAKLTLRSGAARRGTTVALAVPLCTPEAPPDRQEAQHPPEGRDHVRILLAEDHTMFRQCEKEILAAALPGAIFGEAATGDQALDKAQEEHWDVIVLDLTMPGRSGIGVLRSLRRSGIQTPVVMLSMHPQADFGERARRAGCSGYVEKDRASIELVQAIQTVLNGGSYFLP